MSRSTRQPYFTEDNKSESKKRANKKVRRLNKIRTLDDIEYSDSVQAPNGSGYKKQFQSWDICDFGWHVPNDEKLTRK